MKPFRLVLMYFHQVEGLYIDKDVSFADLKQTFVALYKEMFGNQNPFTSFLLSVHGTKC
jgi:phenylalanyl-tRNA synthetase alpha subunit